MNAVRDDCQGSVVAADPLASIRSACCNVRAAGA